MQILKANKKTHYALLFIILILSAYTHLWNPTGFPDIFFDEGIYMRRAMTTLDTGNPQEAYFYDHPYFGQLVLGSILKLIDFPNSIDSSPDTLNYVEMLYLVPRVLMGLFAILDTFLIYKISEKRFGKRLAILASILFAVMPITWLFRRILLDTILMPFLLSSILLALYSKNSKHATILVTSSSILLGLAIFTKTTTITMIPVVAYIVVSGHGFKTLTRWLPPVFMIPLIWPGVAIYLGHLNNWFRDVFWQAGRNTGQFLPTTHLVFMADPVLIGMGFASFVFAIYKRNLLLIFWFVPFLLFVNIVGFFQYFHYILILPAMCVAIAFMIDNNLQKIQRLKLQKYIYGGIVVGFIIYGGIVSTSIIINNVTEPQFQAMQYAIHTFNDKEFTLVASPVYTWIFSNIFEYQNIFLDYADILYYEHETKYQYLIVDPHFLLDQNRSEKLYNVLNNTKSVKTFALSNKPDTNLFPNQNFKLTGESYFIDIKTDKVESWP